MVATQIFFYFHPYLGRISNLTSIFFHRVGSITFSAKDLKILRDCSGEAPTYTTCLLQLQRRIHQRILVLHHHVAGRVPRKQDWFWVERECFVVQCAHLCHCFPLTIFFDEFSTPWNFRASFQCSKLFYSPEI